MSTQGRALGLVKVLEQQASESTTSSFEVGEQRERNYRYYSLQPMGNERPGRSQYISPDVLDAVEGKKAVFSETFLSVRQAVKFSNCAYPGEAEAKTAYVNQNFKRNKYERLFRDGWHDAFVAKRMVVFGEWERDDREETLQVQQQPMPAVQQQIQALGRVTAVNDENAQITQVPTPQGPLPIVSGELVATIDTSYLRLALIAPERFFRDPEATYPDESMWCGFEDDVSRGMMVSKGYDPDQVEGLSLDYLWSRAEDAARKAHDKSWTRRQSQSRAPSQQSVTLLKTWTWMTPEDFEGVQGIEEIDLAEDMALYEIHWAHGEVMLWAGNEERGPRLAIRQVEDMPFFEWSEMKVSHAENGLCTADVVAHSQRTSSNLKRLILDNQAMANASRTTAVKGAVVNPRDLLDNAIGSVVWLKRPDAVGSLPTPPLSPLTLQVLGLMKQDSEERSGLSGMAKGMNTDVVKYQNADSMVERLTTAGQRRVTMAARDFANTFLIPLAQFIVAQGMLYDQGQSTMEVAGSPVPIVPSQWQDSDLNMDTAVALTPDEGQSTAQRLLAMNTVITQDEEMKPLYGLEQKHALFDMVYDLMGISDTSTILLPPQTPEVQQAVQSSQAMTLEAQELRKQMEVEGLKGQQATNRGVIAQIQALQSGDQREWQKFNWDRTNDMEDNLLNQQKQDWTEVVDIAELQLEKEQKRNVSVNNS